MSAARPGRPGSPRQCRGPDADSVSMVARKWRPARRPTAPTHHLHRSRRRDLDLGEVARLPPACGWHSSSVGSRVLQVMAELRRPGDGAAQDAHVEPGLLLPQSLHLHRVDAVVLIDRRSGAGSAGTGCRHTAVRGFGRPRRRAAGRSRSARILAPQAAVAAAPALAPHFRLQGRTVSLSRARQPSTDAGAMRPTSAAGSAPRLQAALRTHTPSPGDDSYPAVAACRPSHTRQVPTPQSRRQSPCVYTRTRTRSHSRA